MNSTVGMRMRSSGNSAAPNTQVMVTFSVVVRFGIVRTEFNHRSEFVFQNREESGRFPSHHPITAGAVTACPSLCSATSESRSAWKPPHHFPTPGGRS